MSGQSGDTVLGELSLIALETEGAVQGLSHRRLIVDNQNSHHYHCAEAR